MKLNILCLFLLTLSTLSFLGCTDNNENDWSEEITVDVDSLIVPCKIWGNPNIVDGIRIKEGASSKWDTIAIHSIEGFEFEAGYLYVLKLKVIHLVNPPQDDSNIRYRLIRVLTKEKA